MWSLTPARFVTVTKAGAGEQSEVVTACAWCGRPIGPSSSAGRPRTYCKRSCRQRAYEARRRSAELGLSEYELVVTRADLDALRDQVFVLRRTIADAQRALGRGADGREAHELLGWIVEAAAPLS